VFPLSREKAEAKLRAEMIDAYPDLKDVKTSYIWGGSLGWSVSEMPLVGRTPEGIWYGRGRMTSVHTALSDMIAHSDPTSRHVHSTLLQSADVDLCISTHQETCIYCLPSYRYTTAYGGHGLVPTAVGADLVVSAILSDGGDQRYELYNKTFPPRVCFCVALGHAIHTHVVGCLGTG
jgi:glycine/D-amino acid oxidase-like deaminating enzyme